MCKSWRWTRVGNLVGIGQSRRVGEQSLGVVVLRPLQHLLHRPGLDDAAVLHHGDPLGDRAHQRQVVRDEQDAQARDPPAARATTSRWPPARTRRERSSPRRTAAPSDGRSARARWRRAGARRRRVRRGTSRRSCDGSETRSKQPGDLRRRASRRSVPSRASGRATDCPTVRRGFSDPYGFWKMYWMSRFIALRRCGPTGRDRCRRG